MKITHEQIIKLAAKYPNDGMLGSAIRELVVKANINTNEIYVDPTQISLLDSINEITNNGNGIRY